MTLIFSWLTHEYVLQVADRLLTSEDPATATIDRRDPVANKSVIFRAKNGLVAIGYSGHAYLQGMHTDQWIVETITGEKTFEFADGQPRSRFGQTAQWLDVGNAMLTLERELNRSYPRTDPALQLTMAGWQWRRDPARARPVIGGITNRPARTTDPDFTSGWKERAWHLEKHPSDARIRRVLLDSIGWNPLSLDETDELKRRLGRVWHSPAECQQMLADAIRVVAARPNSTVGPNCMSVFIPHPRYGRMEANFLAAEKHRAAVSGGGRPREECEVGFTPWIVGPNKIRPPAMIIGAHAEPLDPVTLFIDGPESPSPHLLWGRFEQTRPNQFGTLPPAAPSNDWRSPPLPPPPID